MQSTLVYPLQLHGKITATSVIFCTTYSHSYTFSQNIYIHIDRFIHTEDLLIKLLLLIFDIYITQKLIQ